MDEVRKAEAKERNLPKATSWAVLKAADDGRLTEKQQQPLTELETGGLTGSNQFCYVDADVLRGDDLSLLLGCSYDRASGQVVGPSEEATGALLYGDDGRIREEVLFNACDFEVCKR
ncbi:hypothetical protein DFAR_350005 [Desulfarculales bacterium]